MKPNKYQSRRLLNKIQTNPNKTFPNSILLITVSRIILLLLTEVNNLNNLNNLLIKILRTTNPFLPLIIEEANNKLANNRFNSKNCNNSISQTNNNSNRTIDPITQAITKIID